jgi:hypothetical protein
MEIHTVVNVIYTPRLYPLDYKYVAYCRRPRVYIPYTLGFKVFIFNSGVGFAACDVQFRSSRSYG